MKTIVLSMLFVVLYASGFVAAKYGLPYADPVSFLVIRFAITATILGLVCWVAKITLPSKQEIIHSMLAGMLMVGVFSLGVFIAMNKGLSASTAALIISFQPLLASLISSVLFKEKVSLVQWVGLFIGLFGVLAIVFWGLESPNIFSLVMAFIGLLGVAIGSVYQKYYCANVSVLLNGFLQTFAAFMLSAVIWIFYPTEVINWTPNFISALLWMAIIVSVGAFSLLYVLIRSLPISKVSTLFYLIPIATLVLSLMFLDGHISAFQGVGIVLVSLSVFMVAFFEQKETLKKLKPHD